MARTHIGTSLITPLDADLAAGGFKLTGLANGTAATDSAAFGQIATLQTKSFLLSGVVLTTNSVTYVDTTLLLAFTPTKATNKVLVRVISSASNNVATGDFIVTIFRDAVDLFSASGGYRLFYGVFSPGAVCMEILDSPATISTVTYKVRLRSAVAGNGVTLGNSATSTITCQEVLP